MNIPESVVLVTLHELIKQDKSTSIRSIVDAAKLSDKTISSAIGRLERSGRLRVRRRGPGLSYKYDILKPPTDLERTALKVHLASKRQNGQVA